MQTKTRVSCRRHLHLAVVKFLVMGTYVVDGNEIVLNEEKGPCSGIPVLREQFVASKLNAFVVRRIQRRMVSRRSNSAA